MVDQTVPRQRGQTTENHTDAIDLGTDGATPAEHEQRRYVCLDCGSVSPTFHTECGECGGEQFQTLTPAARTQPRLIDRVLGWVTRLTASLNPYIPR